MIGKLTIDKASMNMSYFLYSLEIIKNNGGMVSRKKFGQDMAAFIKAPAIIEGKENRTPFNKSKLPRYFGFIDLIEDNDDQFLTLTNRGKELVEYIEYNNLSSDPAELLHIKEEYKQRFVELMMQSVLFDAFGKNNCGAEQSCTDIEPPKVVFKTLLALSRANAEEICLVMYGLNRAHFSSFDEAINKIKNNRKIGIHTYEQIMKDWGIENIAHDCKIINIFTDSNIRLISSEKEPVSKITYYELTPIAKEYEKEISNMSVFYEPLQLNVFCESKNEKANQWIQNNVLGKVGNTKFIYEIDCDNITEVNNFSVQNGSFEEAILKAFSFPKNNVYVIIKHIDRVKKEELFGRYSKSLERINDFKSLLHGCSINKVENKDLYEKIIKNNRNAREILNETNSVVIPSNLNIVGIVEMENNMENQVYDYEFKTCLLKTEQVEEDKNQTIEEKIISKYKQMDFSEMESEIDQLYDDFTENFSPKALLRVNDKDLPRYMFFSEKYNQTNMCWNLEHNPKLKKYFGAVGGGSAYVYGLHYSQKHNSWMTGPGNKPTKLDENGAIEVAKEIRQKLIDAVSIVKKYEGTQDVAKYSEMHTELEEQCGNDANKLWFKKYLHMMFPHMFATFYNYEWLTFLNRKCGFEQHDDLYEISGELSFLANRVKLPNSVVAKVLFELFGYPNQEKKEELDNENEEENTKMVDRKPRINRINPLNSIIYGAPGTGKTYSTAEYAVAFVEGRKPNLTQMTTSERELLMKKYRELTQSGQVVFTTFHQSYGYEEFIQGLRPDTKDGEMRFVPADGVFKKIADKAMKDQENNYVIIIDEINRGNISKIFGELITLIEEDKRWGEINQLSVMLPSGQEFAVPNNLYIVGTMNSADKSIALIDTALRRRFEFIEVAPNEDLIKDATLKNVLVQLNAVLRKQLESSDLLIGHAYFIGKNKDDLANILNRNIIPLLYEYFYDNEKKVKDALAKAIEGTDVKINETINGRIRVE